MFQHGVQCIMYMFSFMDFVEQVKPVTSRWMRLLFSCCGSEMHLFYDVYVTLNLPGNF